MAEITTFDADWLLEQWIRWCRYGQGGGKPILAHLVGSSIPSPVVTDGEALAIDGVVAQLLLRMPEIGEAVVHFYSADRNYSAVSSIMDIDRKTATRYVGEGVAWVDGKLDDCPGLSRVKKVFSCLRRGEKSPEMDSLSKELAEYWSKVA